MDIIRKYLSFIRTQLASLTISQRLVIGLLGVIVVGTIVWTVMYSAKPQMVPLIAKPMSAEEINRVEMALKGKYEYQVNGNQIMVPVAQAYSIRGELASQQLLPKDLSNAFDDAILNGNLFDGEAQKGRVWNNARQHVLTEILTRFPYVENGSIIISLGEPAALGRQPVPSTATVYVATRNGAPLNSEQVQAISGMVSGTVPGMKDEDVHVIIFESVGTSFSSGFSWRTTSRG